MQIKHLLLIALLLAVTNQVTVTKTDQCDDCTQFKSSVDCKSQGCTWTEKTATTPGSCAKTTTPPPVAFTPYCQTIETANCSKTFGCALIEGKCTHFTGCSAYVKTTHPQCQEISYQCITNGVTCAPALGCIAYTKEQCETTPSLFSPFKCIDNILIYFNYKLEGDTCRDYKCIEADTSLTTNAACSGWLAGCKTTGAGCIDIIPPCASYQGTSETCPKMRGTDGNCEFNPDSNNCRVRVCTGADTGLNTNEACSTYQAGCVTTGKGCIATLGACSSYNGNATTCIGYIGTDGYCAGDATGTNCRARKCDEKTATTDEECNTWKTGCKSNGRSCVDALALCSTYDGTITTCANLKGTDGNCKGTSTTTAKCSVKDCKDDSNTNFTTQAQCTAIQSFCKTTGKGCLATLLNCSSYPYTDDGTSCNSLYGLDGRCKKAATGTNCAARVCTEAPNTLTTNKQCDDYKSDCVTTGAGCVARTVCQDTVKQITCEGTTSCGWNSICVSKTSCGQLLTKSICESVKINNKPYYKWGSSGCIDAKCDDFTAIDDNTCNTLLDGCVTNGTKCVDGRNCPAQFKGSQQTCQGFSKVKCTNDDGVADTAACKTRTCDDSYLTFDNDTDCGNYQTGCVTKGRGCIIDTAPCNSYSGTPDQCDKFKGNKTTRCWNTSATGACVDKACTQATGMTDDAACEGFLTGCLYDGNASCVPKSALCTSYTGNSTTCLNFKGLNGTTPCMVGSGGKCKAKTCYDDSTSTSDGECGEFLTGCVTDGLGCIDKTSPCTSYQGTTEKCLTFSGNSGADKCTRLEACISKSLTCTSKTGVANNADCILYHNDCRLKYGDTSCIQQSNNCTGYLLTGTADADKQTYCNSITTSGGSFCAYNTSATGTCQARTCNLWVSTLTGISCVDYNGPASCKLNGTYCYSANTCGSYVIPATVAAAEKLTWCRGMFDNSTTPKKCQYDQAQSSTNCANYSACEDVVSPISAADCNLQINGGTCQFAGGKCITTKTACSGYSLTGITTANASAYCSALRQLASNVVTQCKYDAGTVENCIAVTAVACNSVASPTSQASCDAGTGSCIVIITDLTINTIQELVLRELHVQVIHSQVLLIPSLRSKSFVRICMTIQQLQSKHAIL